MPHIVLEHTDNIVEINFNMMLIKIHDILSKRLPTRLENCKSRIIKHSDYLVGDGNSSNAFVSIAIAVMSGREQELLSLIAEEIRVLIKESLVGSNRDLNLQSCVSIKNLPSIYYKDLEVLK